MSLLVSCASVCYGPFGIRGAVENVGRVGLGHVELPVWDADYRSRRGDLPLVTTDSSLSDLQEVERYLEQHGVRAASCSILSGGPLDEATVRRYERKIDLASHFGVPLVIAETGEAHTPEERRTILDNLRRLGDHAEGRGITIGLETHPGLCQDHYGMFETMQELDHPRVRLNFDTANLLYYNAGLEYEVALARVCGWVKGVHLKDSRGEYGRYHFPTLGRGGAIDFVRTLQILNAAGFPGPYTIEIAGTAGEEDLPLEGYHQRVEESVAFLRNCGYFD